MRKEVLGVLALAAIVTLGPQAWPTTSVGAQSVVATVTVPAGPTRMALDDVNNRLYVVDSGTTKLSVINASTNSLVTSVELSKTPVGVAVNTTTRQVIVSLTDGNLAIVNGADNTLVTNASFC